MIESLRTDGNNSIEKCRNEALCPGCPNVFLHRFFYRSEMILPHMARG